MYHRRLYMFRYVYISEDTTQHISCYLRTHIYTLNLTFSDLPTNQGLIILENETVDLNFMLSVNKLYQFYL